MSNIIYQGVLVNKLIPQAIAEASQNTVDYAKRIVQVKTPIDTGKLRASWQTKLESRGFSVLNNTPYAKYVEFGTRYMLTFSVDQIKDKFEAELVKSLRGE
jgi:hypothetical protein